MPTLRHYPVAERIAAPPPPGPRDGGRADALRTPPRIDWSRVDRDVIMNNRYVRLNAIYRIVDSDGKLTDFGMKPEQFDYWSNKHSKNIVLKSRQIGFTTLIQLDLLDIAIFTPNTSCGVIAHTKEDAEKFFNKKIKLAWEHFPPELKQYLGITATQDAAGVLKFSNGSSIAVGTSMRSDTLQYLHISEFGKLCAKFPEKAAEVVSGALNTVSPSNYVVIESTGEGTHGHFFDMCKQAQKLADMNAELSPMDYKFFFYPWWTDPKYVLHQHKEVEQEDRDYFLELAKTSNIKLTRIQRNWYITKRLEQQERMWREYPSTPSEAFRGIIDGAPLARTMALLRRMGRITSVPWARTIPVDTFWDLGRNDKTAIWFMQAIGFERRFIDYYESNLRPLSDYANILNQKPYIYGVHHLPHDAEVTELTQTDSLSRREVLQGLIPGRCITVPRISTEEDGVNMTRENMGNVWFDATRCDAGIQCLEQVKYRFDEKLQEFQPQLLRTKFKHGYDAFAQYGHGYRHGRGNGGQQQSDDRTPGVGEMDRASRAKAAGREGAQKRVYGGF